MGLGAILLLWVGTSLILGPLLGLAMRLHERHPPRGRTEGPAVDLVGRGEFDEACEVGDSAPVGNT